MIVIMNVKQRWVNSDGENKKRLTGLLCLACISLDPCYYGLGDWQSHNWVHRGMYGPWV